MNSILRGVLIFVILAISHVNAIEIEDSNEIDETFFSKGPCEISENRDITIRNLQYNCKYGEMKKLFTALPAGDFPPNGMKKGSVLLCPGGPCQIFESFLERIWNGKKIYYIGGKTPNDQGVVINSILNLTNAFMALIYRSTAPFDNKEVLVIDYKPDSAVSFITDYIRQAGEDLYLGMMSLRVAPQIPIVFFLLEGTPNPKINKTLY